VNSIDEKNKVKATIEQITVPASNEWIAGRVSTLLDHYFTAPFPAPAMQAVAQDWIKILGNLPPWAIQAACMWWLSEDNPNAHRKPLPGDIAKRAKAEMGIVRLAEGAVRRFVPNRGTQ